MNKEEMLKNFYDLHSEDDSVVYQAVMAKKDWILDKFYVPFSFAKNDSKCHVSDLECLKKQAIPFKQISTTKKVLNNKELLMTNLFNEKFMRAKLYNKRFKSGNCFWVQFDFTKLDHATYKAILANVFPAMDESILDINYDSNKVFDLLKFGMIGDFDNEVRLILDRRLLHLEAFNVGCVSAISIYNDTDKDSASEVKLIAKNLHVPFEVINE